MSINDWAGIPDADRALDRSRSPDDRIATLRSILMSNTSAGKELLRRIASDVSEPGEMLTLAGRQLARLMWADAVSEFDMRDLTEIAGEIVFTAKPDELWSW
ncbi:MAG: hypothetical protein RL499_958 [Actinomycetota bacterium]